MPSTRPKSFFQSPANDLETKGEPRETIDRHVHFLNTTSTVGIEYGTVQDKHHQETCRVKPRLPSSVHAHSSVFCCWAKYRQRNAWLT